MKFNDIASKLVAITHTPLWMNMTIHFPLGVAIVSLFPNWGAFAAACSIGPVKDIYLDRKFGSGTSRASAIQASVFYVLGAITGAIGGGLIHV